MKRKRFLSVDYAVVSILANLPSDVSTLTTEKPLLHTFFYNLRNKQFSLLKDIAFETNYFPYSESIEQAFDNIEMAGLISKTNQIFQKFTLNRKALNSFFEREIKSNLSSRQIKEIENVVRDFPELIAQP